MITAEEARKQSIAHQKEQIDNLKNIEREINNAIAQGKFYTTVSCLSDVAKAALKDLGYELEYYRGDSMIDARWAIRW